MKDNRQARAPLRAMTVGMVKIVIAAMSLACVGGCVSQMRAQSTRPVQCDPVEAFVVSDIFLHAGGKLGVFHPVVPGYTAGVEKELNQILVEKLLGSRIFAKITSIPRSVRNDGEALWWGLNESCDLVMEPEVLYLLSGSGTMPTRLDMRIRILDTRTGETLWDLKQKAYSEPGMDADLFWHTYSGQPAQKYRVLAMSLGEQLAQFLAASYDPETQTRRK